MIAVEDSTTIHITRGDKTTGKVNRLAFCFPVYNFETEQEEYYKFKPEDKISFIVMQTKGYTKYEILRKEYYLKDLGYTEETEHPIIPLQPEDTKMFELTNKAKNYWYDLVLNDDTTIIGMDADGAKQFIVYPEGGESNE